MSVKQKIKKRLEGLLKDFPTSREFLFSKDGHCWPVRKLADAEVYVRDALGDRSMSLYVVNRDGNIKKSTWEDRNPSETVSGQAMGNIEDPELAEKAPVESPEPEEEFVPQPDPQIAKLREGLGEKVEAAKKAVESAQGKVDQAKELLKAPQAEKAELEAELKAIKGNSAEAKVQKGELKEKIQELAVRIIPLKDRLDDAQALLEAQKQILTDRELFLTAISQ